MSDKEEKTEFILSEMRRLYALQNFYWVGGDGRDLAYITFELPNGFMYNMQFSLIGTTFFALLWSGNIIEWNISWDIKGE